MSQARKRIRITPQKGINQLTQTSFGLDESSKPAAEAEDAENAAHTFLDSPLCSTLKDGLAMPVRLGTGMMEYVSGIEHPNRTHHYTSFLVPDEGSGSDDDKENEIEEGQDKSLENSFLTPLVARKGVAISVQRMEPHQECGESDNSFDNAAEIEEAASLIHHDSNMEADSGIPSSSSASQASFGPLYRDPMFTRLKRKLTLSLSESKDLTSSSNSNTPVKEQSQTPVGARPVEGRNYSFYARSIIRLRNAMNTAFDIVAPRIRTGSPLLYITEEFISRVRQNVLKPVRDRDDENLYEKTFASEAEYLAVNNTILPKANENNQCALCTTESLSVVAFSKHKSKHILGFKVLGHAISHHANLTT